MAVKENIIPCKVGIYSLKRGLILQSCPMAEAGMLMIYVLDPLRRTCSNGMDKV